MAKKPATSIVKKTPPVAKRPGGLKNTKLGFWHSPLFWRRVGIGALVLFGLFVLSALWFLKDLPGPNGIKKNKTAVNTVLLDRTGKTTLYELHGDINRSIIQFGDMPAVVRNATVSVEDKNFYRHGAIDPAGIARAAIFDLTNHALVQGGSTLTQQFIKNAVLSDQRSVWRKYKELVMSVELELFNSKDNILRMYLNEIPYGSQAYGIQAASQTFFGVNASSLGDGSTLSLSRSALLAALPNAPSYFSPYGAHTDDTIIRRNLILKLMAEQGYITSKQRDDAQALTLDQLGLKQQTEYQNIRAPHFVQYVREQLVDKYGEKTVDEGGLKVTTTLDLSKQDIAEDVISKHIATNKRAFNASNAALVSADPKTGEVLAMVGSADFNNKAIDGNVNVATSNRQPGSSFKPFAYATAWKKNYFPGSTIFDLSTDFGGGYQPANYNHQQYGPLPMRQTLDNSLNISAVKTLYLGGVNDTIQTAHDMGITTLTGPSSNYGLSLVLGGGEVKLVDMAAGYGTFANNGVNHKQKVILKVTDQRNSVLQDNTKADKGHQVLDPQVAYEVQNVLSDNNSRSLVFGTHSPLTFGDGRPVAAKTGTTENFRDAWTMGFTPSLVTGVWTGNSDGTLMTSGSDGVVVAAPIWHDYMVRALAGTSTEQFNRPSGIKELTVDALTSKKPGPGTRQTRTDIAASWVTLDNSPNTTGQTYRIDKVSKKLATDLTPPDAVETVTAAAVHCEIPQSDPSYSRWEPPVEAWARSHGYGGTTIPTDYDDVHTEANRPSIDITSPNDGSSSGSPVTVTMTVNAPLGVDHVDVLVDGAVVTQASGSGSTYTASVSADAGQHTIKAVVHDQAFWSASSGGVTVNLTGSGGSVSFGSPTCSAGTFSASASGNPSKVELFKNGSDYAAATGGGGVYTAHYSGSGTYYFAGYKGGNIAGISPAKNCS